MQVVPDTKSKEPLEEPPIPVTTLRGGTTEGTTRGVTSKTYRKSALPSCSRGTSSLKDCSICMQEGSERLAKILDGPEWERF